MKQGIAIRERVMFIFLVLMITASAGFFSSCKKDAMVTPAPSANINGNFSTMSLDATTASTGLTHEQWTNVSGNDVSEIPLSTTPSSTTNLSSLELPNTSVASTGDRIRGYITAPTTGSYTFWIAGDDAAELWLSTDATPAKAVKIASFVSWTNFRQWNKYGSQQSAAITLTAGTKYYIQVLHKQGAGDGSLSVQWQMPGGAYETPIPANRLTPYVTAPVVPTGLLHEQWTNVSGNDVSEIPLTTTANSTTNLSALELPNTSVANTADRIRGYITAPTTGNYTFWVAGDDAAELWLSTDATPAHAVKIASFLSWTNFRQWNKYSSQQSASVKLTAGTKYYIQVLHKQGGGDGSLSVQWQLPGGAYETPIPASRLTPYNPSATATTAVAAVSSIYTVSGVINLTNQHDITISGKAIAGGNVPCITLTNCYNIHIIGCKLYNSTDVGIHMYKCYNVTVNNSFFTNVASGVYAEQTTNGGIVVNYNQFLNMVGPFPRGQFVQFNNVNGAGSAVTNNKGENILNQSHAEDAISMYQSNGTASSPIMISGNWIRGGGPSSSGGGIMLGDEGGSYLTAQNNILVNPGEYGMAIAGGDHNSIQNNIIYSTSQYFTNVGLYVNSINGYTVTNATVSGNKVLFYNNNNYANNCWLAPGTNKPSGWDTSNTWGASLSSAILPSVIITNN